MISMIAAVSDSYLPIPKGELHAKATAHTHPCCNERGLL
jgi:hypothetical protein